MSAGTRIARFAATPRIVAPGAGMIIASAAKRVGSREPTASLIAVKNAPPNTEKRIKVCRRYKYGRQARSLSVGGIKR